jgi:octaprenyl-diphosphate synthase
MRPRDILIKAQAPIVDDLVRVERVLDSVRSSFSDELQPLGDHALSTSGKRIRPTILLLCAGLCHRSNGIAPEVAAVVELIHIATLIHDDSIDGGKLRRGKPTVNAEWNHEVATMLGDVLYSRAFEILLELGETEVSLVLAKASHIMSRGELREFMVRHRLINEQTYLELIWAKTASFISACCRAGAILGGLSDVEQESIARYGERVGMAFQVVDDILDYTSTQEQLGKETMLDLKDGKVTLPLIAAIAQAGDEKEAVLKLVEEVKNGQSSALEIAEMIRKHGGLVYAAQLARSMAMEATAELAVLPDSHLKQSLELVARYAVERER